MLGNCQGITNTMGYARVSFYVLALDTKSLTRALDQLVILTFRASQAEDAGGEIAISAARRHVIEIFQYGRTELVVMRIGSLKEDQSSGRINQRFGIRASI